MTGEWNVPDSSDPMSSDFNSHCVCFLARSTGRPIDRSLSECSRIRHICLIARLYTQMLAVAWQNQDAAR